MRLNKNILDISDLTKEELQTIIDYSIIDNCLAGKNIGMIFEKPSTRTRLSFACGINLLGGNSIDLKFEELNIIREESFEDTFKAFNCYLDCIVYRTNDHYKLLKASKYFKGPIINALSNKSHPCQIISDLFTLKEIFGHLSLKICWLGDINNVLFSLAESAVLFDEIELNIFSHKDIIKTNTLPHSKNISLYDKIDTKIIQNADCIMTDVFLSMNDKANSLKVKKLSSFKVNEEIMSKTKKDCVFMHCLPAKIDMEVTKKVIESSKSIVWRQAKNRMFAQQKLLANLDI